MTSPNSVEIIIKMGFLLFPLSPRIVLIILKAIFRIVFIEAW